MKKIGNAIKLTAAGESRCKGIGYKGYIAERAIKSQAFFCRSSRLQPFALIPTNPPKHLEEVVFDERHTRCRDIRSLYSETFRKSMIFEPPNPPANFLAIAWMLAMLQLLVISVFIYFRRAFLLGLLTTVRCGWPVAGGLLA